MLLLMQIKPLDDNLLCIISNVCSLIKERDDDLSNFKFIIKEYLQGGATSANDSL